MIIKGFENEDIEVSEFGEWVGNDYIDYKSDYKEHKKIINELLKEKQELKEKLEASEKARKEAIELIKELYDNTDDTTCYDIDKDEKERLLQILDIDKGE